MPKPAAILLLVLTVAAVPLAAQTTTPLPALKKGTYVLEIGESRCGEETFTLAEKGWTTKGWVDLMGQRSEYEFKLSKPGSAWTLDIHSTKAGVKKHYRAHLKEDRATLQKIADGKPTGKKHEVKFKSDRPVVLFENLVWAHLIDYARELTQKARAGTLDPGFTYRAVSAGSLRKFPLRVTEVERTSQTHAGKKLPLWRLVLQLANVEMAMLCTEDGMPVRVQVQSQYLELKLKGYEDLTPPAVKPSTPLDAGPWRKKLSKAKHAVTIEKKVMAPMRDGIKLAADVYRPKKRGKFPVVLTRTPYRRQGQGLAQGMWFARRGYVFVTQDCRGRFDSEGEWYPLRHEVDDGYDTLEWIAKQDWCDGNVGMIGGSYVGWTQLLAAKSGHPALKAIIPMVAPPDPHENIPYEGGTFFMMSAWWANIVEQMARNAEDAKKAKTANKKENEPEKAKFGKTDWNKVFRTLPLTDLDKALGLTHPFLDDWLAHPLSSDPYWKTAQYQNDYNRIKVPALHITGWFDGDQPGAIMNFPALRKKAGSERARKFQWLVVGAWTHAFNSSRRLGQFDFGDQAVIDLNALVLRWFDYHLKGIDNGLDREAPVTVFVMGENRWHVEKDWPLPQTEWTKLYLSGAPANLVGGKGRLALEPKKGPPNTYAYDPADPPSLPIDLDSMEDSDIADMSGQPDRKDVLDFTSAPLAAPVEITGPVKVHLTVSTDAKDTDFAVIVLRVTKAGKVFGIKGGIQRLRYRLGTGKATFVKPGEVVEVDIDCWATGLRMAAGERLRLQVQSSLFPSYSRNLNTGEPEATGTRMKVANQTVFHDHERLSYVLLPVIPRQDAPGIRFKAEQ